MGERYEDDLPPTTFMTAHMYELYNQAIETLAAKHQVYISTMVTPGTFDAGAEGPIDLRDVAPNDVIGVQFYPDEPGDMSRLEAVMRGAQFDHTN